LNIIVSLAGLFVALTPALKTPVLTLTNSLGIRGGSLASAAALFGVPLTLLAMIGPRAIKIFARSLKRIGTASGSVFAFSTAGSVFGTLLLGFILLPEWGARTITYGVSALLFLLAFLLWIYELTRREGARFPLLLILSVAAALSVFAVDVGSAEERPKGFRIVEERESLYGRVRVVDDEYNAIRLLLTDSSLIGVKHLPSGKSFFPYLRILGALPRVHPEGRDALLIGLGAGCLPGLFASHGIATDVIEIDPAVLDAAERFFGFKATGRVIRGDARYEIRGLKKRYDFIIHDCFSGSMPEHLLSREMILDLRARLKEDGIFALNFVGLTREKWTLSSIHRTLLSAFPHTRAFVAMEVEDLVDHIFLASLKPLDEAVALDAFKALERRIPVDQGLVITDDYNPLQSMQAEAAERYREIMLQRLGIAMMAW
jgi:spermidine synthase